MPCRSDYLDPNNRERELQQTAKLLLYLTNRLSRQPTKALIQAASDPYCSRDYVPILCAELQYLKDDDLQLYEEIVYDGRSSSSRELAEWWERHEEADRIRLEKEREQARIARIRRDALAKLTAEEISALGIE